jgi:hypothetical protein
MVAATNCGRDERWRLVMYTIAWMGEKG